MAQLFDGSTTDLVVADKAALDFTSGLTVSVQFKFNSVPSPTGFYTFLAKAAAATWVSPFAVYALRIGSGTSAVLQGWINNGGVAGDAVTSAGTIADTTPHWAALTYDGANLKVYLDNPATAAGTTALVAAISTSTFPLFLGARQGPSDFFGPGVMANLGLYNAALSASDLTKLSQGASPLAVNPVALAGAWFTNSGLVPVLRRRRRS